MQLIDKTDDGVEKIFDASDWFPQRDSHYKKVKFYEARFGLTMLVAVKMGEKVVAKKVKGLHGVAKVNVHGYYVPFIKQLKNLLSLPNCQTFFITVKMMLLTPNLS